jgi:hypothetical protein
LKPYWKTLDFPGQPRKTFIEFWAVRNVIVHRASIVDRRLVEICPWLGLKVGEPLKITPNSYANYRNTTSKYFMELLVRDLVREGFSRNEAEQKINKNKIK